MIKQFSEELSFLTNGKQFINITQEIDDLVNNSGIQKGVLNLSLLHTSASLLIQENADETVLDDLTNFFDDLLIGRNYKHNTEGSDDMPAHIKKYLANFQVLTSCEKYLKLNLFELMQF